MASSGYRHGYPGQGKAAVQTAIKTAVETAAKAAWTAGYRAKNRNATRKEAETAYLVAKATGTALKANDTLKAMAKSLQAGTACKGNKAQLTSQYNGYVKGNSRTDEKTFMRQEQDTATMLVGIAGLVIPASGLAIGGTGMAAGAGTAMTGSLKAKLMATLNKLSEIAGRAAKAGKLTYLTNLVEDMKKKASGDEEETIELSQNDIRHIRKHTFDFVAKQAQHLTNEQLAKKLENTSFFNKEWSMEEVVKHSQEAYNALRRQGKTGPCSIKINGETINVYIKSDGTFDTSYGTYKYTVEDFRRE